MIIYNFTMRFALLLVVVVLVGAESDAVLASVKVGSQERPMVRSIKLN